MCPSAPSATVIDIAKALIGDRTIEIKVTGIRPGEKMHEIMVSEEEANHCVKRGDYYAIRPMLPELPVRATAEPTALEQGVQLRGHDVLDFEETRGAAQANS